MKDRKVGIKARKWKGNFWGKKKDVREQEKKKSVGCCYQEEICQSPSRHLPC